MMKKIFSLLAIFLIMLFVAPLATQAGGSYDINGIGNVCYDGLVPCGKCINSGGSLDEETGKCSGSPNQFVPCTLCHVFIIIHDLTNFFLFSIVLPIAVLMIVIGGILYVLGGNDSGKLQWANRIFYNTFLGLFIIFGAFMLVGTFLSLIGVAEWTGLGRDQWFSINCNISFSEDQLKVIDSVRCE